MVKLSILVLLQEFSRLHSHTLLVHHSDGLCLEKGLEGKGERAWVPTKKEASSRVGPEVITDLDFSDDIALLSEQTTQAQEMLTRVEQASSEVGLRANGKITKVLAYNTGGEINLKTTDGTP